MLELSSSGSVRGVPSNGHPYRDPGPVAAVLQAVLKLLQISLRLSREPFDALAIHPRRPLVLRNLVPRRVQGWGPDDLIHQAEPLASFDAVNQRRHHALRPDRGFRPSPLRVESVCPLLSRSRHCRNSLCHHPDLAPPTPCLPSLGMVLLPTPLAAARGIGTMKGSDFCRGHPPRQISSLTSPCRPGIQTPTTRAARWSLCQSPQRHRLLPGFATNEQARHSFTPNRVCQPTDCRFTSGCFPPRLAATQLPSITEPATGSGADSHRAVKASSRTHSSRPSAGGGPQALSLSRSGARTQASAVRPSGRTLA